jgi:hypothetical protein
MAINKYPFCLHPRHMGNEIWKTNAPPFGRDDSLFYHPKHHAGPHIAICKTPFITTPIALMVDGVRYWGMIMKAYMSK